MIDPNGTAVVRPLVKNLCEEIFFVGAAHLGRPQVGREIWTGAKINMKE